MPTQRIEFTEWTPDRPGVVGNLTVAKNVVPSYVGYIPFPKAIDYSGTASENLNSAVAGRLSTVTEVFAGGSTKLFKLNGSTFALDDVSKTGGYTAIVKWQFVQYGDAIIAANNVNKLQVYYIGGSTNFADLNANAPIAKYVTVVRDFVIAANLSGEADPNKVQWSDINDETEWVSGPTSQSDFQILPDGGNITGITGGEFGLVFLERAIVRMSYIGSPLFFQFDTISRTLGCVEGNSIAQNGGITYFLGEDGFYTCDGQNITPIGNEKIDRWFYANANPSLLFTMSTAIDVFRKIVIWDFENVFGGRSLLIYNWQVNKWSYCDTDVDYLAYISTGSQTLESLDVLGSIDSILTPLDSPLFAGGKSLFAGVRDNKIVSFTGTPSDALITTGDFGGENASVVTLARPIVDNGSAQVAVASRMLLNQVPNFGSYVQADAENRVSLRSAGKYHRLSVIPTGANWSNVLAVDVDLTPQGTR